MKRSCEENTGTGYPALFYCKFCNSAKSAATLELGIKAIERAFIGTNSCNLGDVLPFGKYSTVITEWWQPASPEDLWLLLYKSLNDMYSSFAVLLINISVLRDIYWNIDKDFAPQNAVTEGWSHAWGGFSITGPFQWKIFFCLQTLHFYFHTSMPAVWEYT